MDARSAVLVAPTSRSVILAARTVLADHPRLSMIGTGRGRADPFVIAQAEQSSALLVTEERGGSATSPRIPYVCAQRGFGVRCIDMLGLIRAEGWSFR